MKGLISQYGGFVTPDERGNIVFPMVVLIGACFGRLSSFSSASFISALTSSGVSASLRLGKRASRLGTSVGLLVGVAGFGTCCGRGGGGRGGDVEGGCGMMLNWHCGNRDGCPLYKLMLGTWEAPCVS